MIRISKTARAGLGCATLLGLALMSSAAPAQGDGRPGTPTQRRACTPDVYRLCAAEIPSVSDITNCLRRKKESLSPACRAVFEQ